MEVQYLLRIYNTLTRKTEPFKAAKDKEVKMYTCGPSTYQRPHLGNYRTFLFEDILQRYLEYLGYKVSRLITLTNIEDKAIDSAETAGISVEELTNRNEAIFFREFEQMSIKRPDYAIRASTIVDEAVRLIKGLIEKGVAYKYTHDGAENVYFEPLKFENFGKLAHLDMRNWPVKKRRFHLDTYPGMPWNKGDFILWHGCREGDKVCWETELGKGRPAWNVQDAAMVTKHLGFTIDIACGGIDNLVRHHDYTLAITESISGKRFASYWLHGGHLFVNGKKMSKSKGNVLHLDDVTVKDYQPQHIRFFLIYGNYREKQNFTWSKLAETSRKLNQLKSFIEELQNTKAESDKSSDEVDKAIQSVLPAFEKNMNNDLDVKSAFDEMYAVMRRLHRLKSYNKLGKQELDTLVSHLRRLDKVLQVLF